MGEVREVICGRNEGGKVHGGVKVVGLVWCWCGKSEGGEVSE